MWVDAKCKFLQLADAHIIETEHIKKKPTIRKLYKHVHSHINAAYIFMK